jgi:hypothetical protein
MKRIVYPIVIMLAFCSASVGDEPKKESSGNSDREKLFQKFKEQMSGVKMVGRFTVIGKDDGPLAKDEYTIQKVEKLPEGDKWLIMARIKYGDHDVTVPLPLDVKWAGNTAVITLDDMTIPGLGTFSSRVVIDEGKYAGTWRHDKKGGHLFGVIEKLPSEEKAKSAAGTSK